MLLSEQFNQISNFKKEDKISFYVNLAWELTIAIRSISSYPEITDKEKNKQIIFMNEIQHRVISQISQIRKGIPFRSESDLKDMIIGYVETCPKIKGEVWSAINSAYLHCK